MLVMMAAIVTNDITCLCATMKFKLHDKVKIRSGRLQAQRGRVVGVVNGANVQVHLVKTGKVVSIAAQQVTNYSAAARKAWKTMPARSVGRPVGTKLSNRISVTIRVDKSLWTKFQECESQGLVRDRSGTIESLLRRKLSELGKHSGNTR